MEKPRVHLNGTSADALIEQFANVVHAIRDARNALAEASPNARDYYTQAPDAFTRARIEHNVRDSWLAKIAEEMMEMAEHVADARDGKVSP
jgi:hypothetical protein